MQADKLLLQQLLDAGSIVSNDSNPVAVAITFVFDKNNTARTKMSSAQFNAVMRIFAGNLLTVNQ